MHLATHAQSNGMPGEIGKRTFAYRLIVGFGMLVHRDIDEMALSSEPQACN